MAKQKLLEDNKMRPPRFYRVPGDVVRDRRFADGERLEILRAWRGEADDTIAQQIDDVIADVESRMLNQPLAGHAAE
jgi:hypothetical protein